MTRKNILALLLGLALVLIVSLPALADREAVRDASDTRGFLDIRAVAHGHGAEPSTIQHRLTTDGAWRARALRRRCASLIFAFGTERGRATRNAIVYYRHGLKAKMIDATTGERLERIDVRRPNRRSVVVSFAQSLLGEDLSEYRWSAHTGGALGGCPEGPDSASWEDRAPNRGDIVHTL